MGDHYQTLDVPRDADPDTVKRAYRKKAKDLHPDRAGGDAQAMATLNHAFDVLGDPAKREQYDRTGQDGASATASPEAQAQQRLMVMFDSYLSDGQEFEGDLVAQFRVVVDKHSAAIREGIMLARLKLRKLERSRNRLAGPSLFATLVADKMQHQQQLIALADSELVIDVLVTKLLAEYRDTKPPAPVQTYTTQTAVSSALFAHLMGGARRT